MPQCRQQTYAGVLLLLLSFLFERDDLWSPTEALLWTTPLEDLSVESKGAGAI